MEREDLCGHVRRVGPHFEKQLATLSDLDIVGDVRGSHYMLCVENVADKETKALFDADLHIGDLVADACERRGLIVRPVGHLNILSPPLVMTTDQIDWLVATTTSSNEESGHRKAEQPGRTVGGMQPLRLSDGRY